MAKLVDKTYGDALFELALENSKTDAYLEECLAILNILGENDDIMRLLIISLLELKNNIVE